MEDNKIKLKPIKIGVCGDYFIGKTVICEALLNIEFNPEKLDTCGADKLQTKFILNNGNEIKLILWDIGGNEKFHSMAFNYLRYVYGIVLVFDVTKYNSFKKLDEYLQEISEKYENNKPIVLFGNKVDLPKQEWQVTDEQIKSFAKEKNLPYFKVSAKTRQGIKEGFSYIVNKCYKKLEEKNEHIIIEKENKNIKIENKVSEQEKSNCVSKNNKNKKKK